MKHMLKSVFMKVESTYAATSTFTPSDVILAENVEINPLNMQTDDYAPVSHRFGQSEKLVGGTWCTVQFDVLVGAGGTPVGNISSIPNHDPVLRAGAMARTITAGTNITYGSVDSGEESVGIAYHVDTARYVLMGVRGDLEWIFEEGKAARMRFNGIGLRQPMVDNVLGPYSLPTRPRPLVMTKANTALLLDTYELRCSQLNLKLGNKVEYVNRAYQEEVLLSDRMSGGSVTFELPSVATRDFLGASGICTLATQLPMFVQFGTTPGNRVSWFTDRVQLINPRLSGAKGSSMLTCDLHLPSSFVSVAYF